MTQTAVPTGGDPAAEATGKPAVSGDVTLAELLKEYGEPKPAPTPAPDVVRQLDPLIQYAKGKIESEAADAIKKRVTAAIEYVAEPEEFKDVPKRVVRGFLEAYAAENPTYKAAFEQQDKDPEGWKKAQDAARAAVLEDFKKLPTNRTRTDIEAAVAAVRGSSTAPAPKGKIDPQELFDMPPGQFNAFKRKLLAAGSNRS